MNALDIAAEQLNAEAPPEFRATVSVQQSRPWRSDFNLYKVLREVAKAQSAPVVRERKTYGN